MTRPSVLFFDVNETLLDLKVLKKSVAKALGGKEELVPLWFSTLLHYSLVANSTETYKDFSDIGVAALQMIAAGNDITMTKEAAEKAVVKPFKELSPYPEVKKSLIGLKQQGFKLVALTNSSARALEDKLNYAEIKNCFDVLLSSEPTKKFKPALEVYKWALAAVNIKPADGMMIAAHGWDIAGAQKVGMQTAFISRPGKQLYPLADAPDYVLEDIAALAHILKEE